MSVRPEALDRSRARLDHQVPARSLIAPEVAALVALIVLRTANQLDPDPTCFRVHAQATVQAFDGLRGPVPHLSHTQGSEAVTVGQPRSRSRDRSDGETPGRRRSG